MKGVQDDSLIEIYENDHYHLALDLASYYCLIIMT